MSREVHPISRERFNAFVLWSRSPMASAMNREVEWYADINEWVLGVLCLDLVDFDWSYAVLGRDGDGRFRWIDGSVSVPTQREGNQALMAAMQRQMDSGASVFPQGDETGGIPDLFTPLVEDDKLHHSFRAMVRYPVWVPAISIIREMMRNFVDIDGHFVREFQTYGFDARTWELYLYAYLNEECLPLDRTFNAPDYVIVLGEERICIEAVTVNPTGGATLGSSEPQLENISDAEAQELLKDFVPIKFGSALFSKLNKQPAYWQLEHAAGHPLIFAVADFHAPRSMLWTSTGLQRYLYGYYHEHEVDEHGRLVIRPMKIETHRYGEKEIPSGFFFLPGAENVSAVLHSNSGTLAKFTRMGRLAGFDAQGIRTFREGLAYDHRPHATTPRHFAFEVTPGLVSETWAEGLNMFHNPNAAHPVNPELFPSIAHHFFEGGMVRSIIPDFHPMMSMTLHVGTEGAVAPGTESSRVQNPKQEVSVTWPAVGSD
jgi:hypothetical protein